MSFDSSRFVSSRELDDIQGYNATAMPEIISIFQSTLEEMISEAKLGTSGYNIYTGTAGIAYVLWLVFKSDVELPPSLTRKTILSTARELLELPDIIKGGTFLTGALGPHALNVVMAMAEKKSKADVAAAIEGFEACLRYSIQSVKNGPNELLNGRAGVLQGILFMLAQPEISNYGSCVSRCKQTMVIMVKEMIRDGVDAEGIFHFSWKDKEYLGGAHGYAGILLMMMKVAPCFDPDQCANLKEAIKNTARQIYSEGQTTNLNMASSLPLSEKDKLVHWCHGAPGWFAPFKMFDMRVEAEQMLRVTMERGCLFHPGMCHGIGGNGTILLQGYKWTKHYQYRDRACQWLQYADDHRDRLAADNKTSLFEGIAGLVILALNILTDQCMFPGLYDADPFSPHL